VNLKNIVSSGWMIVFASFYLFFTQSACTSKSRGKDLNDKKEFTQASNPLERQFDGGSYCVQTFAQGPPPPQALHFSNKVKESDGSAKDFEADLSGDNFDETFSERHPVTDMDRDLAKMASATPIAIRDGFAESTHVNHYTRADKAGWAAGSNGIALGGTPWGLFVAKPPVTQAGGENVNGYDTVKYAVDTTHQSQLEKFALLYSGQLKDYNITGTAWVLKSANCVLQYDIDFEQDGKDGTVKKTHYEGTVTKK